MSEFSALSFTVDSAPGDYGFAPTIRLDDDSWPTDYKRPYVPFVFGLSETNQELRFPLSESWLYVEMFSSAEIYVVFEDRDRVVISAPFFLSYGMTVKTTAKFMRIVAVKRAGHMRIMHGGTDTAVIPTGSGVVPETNTMEFGHTNAMTWTAYQAATGSPSDGTVRVADYDCNFSGNASSAQLLSVNATGVVAANFEFLFYGFAVMGQETSLIGTVTGGIIVREFQHVYSQVLNSALASANASFQATAWARPAVYYKLTAAGIAAGAGLVIPDRRFISKISRFYNRTITEFAKA